MEYGIEPKISNATFHFQSPNRCDSHNRDDPDSMCRISVWPLEMGAPPRNHIVVATEVSKNPGMSVTNSWEVLGPQLEKDLGFAVGSIMAVERYGPFSYRSGGDEEERLSVIQYRAGQGVWTDITFESIDTLSDAHHVKGRL